MHESQGATPGLRARFSSNDHGDAISRTDLVGFGLIEDGPDPALDEIVRIAARITRCEKAFITFAHNDQLHVIASVGSSVAVSVRSSSPPSPSFASLIQHCQVRARTPAQTRTSAH